jgi:hypothetical protein
MVLTLIDSRYSSVFFPMPVIADAGSGDRKSFRFSRLTTVRPSGFWNSEAILAEDLLGATPI